MRYYKTPDSKHTYVNDDRHVFIINYKYADYLISTQSNGQNQPTTHTHTHTQTL